MEQIKLVMAWVIENKILIAETIVAIWAIYKYVEAHSAVKTMIVSNEIAGIGGSDAKATIALARNSLIDGMVAKMYPHPSDPVVPQAIPESPMPIIPKVL